jgi:membrane-associated phospholipid phosphatase
LLAAGLAIGLASGHGATALDLVVVRAMALDAQRQPMLTYAVQAISHFGDPGVRPVLLVAAGLFFLWLHRVKSEWVLLGGSLFSIALVAVLKDAFGRVRPQVVPWLAHPTNMSFPSGHAANTMAILLLFALLAGGSWRIWLAVAAAILVGATRPMLGVHWPGDVLGGWLIGAGVALLVFALARYRILPPGPFHTGVSRGDGATGG